VEPAPTARGAVDAGATPWGAGALLALFGFALRMLHNATLLDSPVYWHPLGGHVVFLKDAATILGGDWLPGSRPFTENSPLYPYVLALSWSVFGENYLLTRLLTMAADAGTIALVTALGARHFGRRAGIAAGLVYAVYAPAIFFSTELIYTSYAVLLSTAAVWWIEGRSARSTVAAGVATGLAIDLMPSLMLGVPLLLLTPFIARQARPLARAATTALALALTIAPVTLANWINSSQLVLLTTGFGHAFYIGHNSQAQAGYNLPNRIGPVTFSNRGSIFDNMKAVASTVTGHELTDAEVSPFFTHKALEQIAAHPGFEARLAAERIAAVTNGYEATTYGDFYFERQRSALLRGALTFDLLLPLTLLGCLGIGVRRRFALLGPIATGVATVLVFFYLARFRMPMIPMLCVFAGHGAIRAWDALAARAWRPVLAGAVATVAVVLSARIAWVAHDSANEWNKEGAVWMSLGKLDEAERAFQHARGENPNDASAYLNLARLYEHRGDTANAVEMRRQGAARLAGAEGEDFRRQLSAAPPPASSL
jgi:4-amino-4-deoxy-L-arabinose transferase-like glycosyltransferase